MSASSETQDFRSRLERVPAQARKLLAHAAELAYSTHREERTPDVAYLPELHESCGLDVEAMYANLQKLEAARLIDLEGEYPFQDVKLRDEILRDMAERSAAHKVHLQEVLGEMRFDLLL
ncbi:MAG: hypothetical protein JOZ43_06975 [Acidobacteriales bacterium]|nr:hypothetical protein [Terriglobales bacterium]